MSYVITGFYVDSQKKTTHSTWFLEGAENGCSSQDSLDDIYNSLEDPQNFPYIISLCIEQVGNRKHKQLLKVGIILQILENSVWPGKIQGNEGGLLVPNFPRAHPSYFLSPDHKCFGVITSDQEHSLFPECLVKQGIELWLPEALSCGYLLGDNYSCDAQWGCGHWKKRQKNHCIFRNNLILWSSPQVLYPSQRVNLDY